MEALSKLPLVSKLNELVGRKPAPAPKPIAPETFPRDTFQRTGIANAAAQAEALRKDEKQQLSLASRYGVARLKGHFAHKGDFDLGVKRTDDLAMARKQVEFLAALDGMIANKQKTDATFPRAALLEGIKVTTDAGRPENVQRRLTVPLGGPQSAKELAEAAFAEIF